MTTIYDFNVTKPDGDRFPLYHFAGKPVLIVNTASKCKFTPQFDDLQKLYDQYREQGLEVVGFPCNQFAEQEPGSSHEAESFCQINYGVKFSIFSKIDVNGNQAHPLFDYLKKEGPFEGFDEENINAKLLKLMISDKAPQWLHGDAIKWNFTKFLIDREGKVVKRFEPVHPIDDIKSYIEQVL
ncbi:glutathione peroxidase [Paenibacillus faecalis]|uniref:glutathione peroxidase n=1 Tax=Paenibacillus faecalis TaxID=2079532 RepID=UPI000D10DCBD|nr:glutathione peroxidase [Paenibacillus faecalis]